MLHTDGREIDIEEKEEFMYRMDEKSDGEGGLGGGEIVVEEGGGGVGQAPSQAIGRKKKKSGLGGAVEGEEVEVEQPGDVSAGETLGDEDAYGDEDVDVELSEKGDEAEYGWEEGYEQEV